MFRFSFVLLLFALSSTAYCQGRVQTPYAYRVKNQAFSTRSIGRSVIIQKPVVTRTRSQFDPAPSNAYEQFFRNNQIRNQGQRNWYIYKTRQVPAYTQPRYPIGSPQRGYIQPAYPIGSPARGYIQPQYRARP